MFHLRFTPIEISDYTFDFLENISDRYILAQEDLDDEGNPLLHYHILIDSQYGEKSIRDAAKTSLKIPKGGRGKNNAHYALITDWKDPGYICKYGNIIRKKGFSEREVMDYVISGKNCYLVKTEKPELSGDSVAPAVISTNPKTKKNTDKEIIADLITWYYTYQKDNKESPTNKQIIKQACLIVRSHGKGINQFKIRDYIHALWFDTEDNQDFLINKISQIL